MKTRSFAVVFVALLAPASSAAPEPATTPSPGDAIPVGRRGIVVGAPVPPFQAVDQSGRVRTLASIAGPKGSVIVFVRSADW